MIRERKESGALGLFVAGAVVGAATALLLAPESGKRSRRKLSRWLHDHKADDVLLKLKNMLVIKPNGHSRHLANGRAGDHRRHGRSV
jgi:gas vesicle protein